MANALSFGINHLRIWAIGLTNTLRVKYKVGFVGVICHPERSEGSPIAQNKPERNEILRLTAQNDNACVGVGEIPLLGEMSRSDKGVMAQP